MTVVFDPGDRIIHTRTFTVPPGSPAPVSVTMTVTYKKPDGTTVTPTLGAVTYDGVGSATATATYTIPADNANFNVWHWRWVCAGDIVAAEQGVFVVALDRVLTP
jgi:hypothetical protein